MNTPAPFGYCPECHAKGLKEKDDQMATIHVYKSCHNLSFVPDPQKVIEAIKNALTTNRKPYDTDMSEYENAKIVNIRKGEKSKGRDKNIYAELRTANGELLVGSTLPYILKVLQERLTAPE